MYFENMQITDPDTILVIKNNFKIFSYTVFINIKSSFSFSEINLVSPRGMPNGIIKFSRLKKVVNCTNIPKPFTLRYTANSLVLIIPDRRDIIVEQEREVNDFKVFLIYNSPF